MNIINPGRNSLPIGPKARPLLRIEIEEAHRHTKSAHAAARWLGVSYLKYKKYAILYGLFEGHKNPTGRGVDKGFSKGKRAIPLREILEGKHPDYSISVLKNRILARAILPPECHLCGYNERRVADQHMPLILTFIDGDYKNKKLENLQLLCYNCMFLTTDVPLAVRRKGIHRGFQRKRIYSVKPIVSTDYEDPHEPLYNDPTLTLTEAELEELYNKE